MGDDELGVGEHMAICFSLLWLLLMLVMLFLCLYKVIVE